MTVGGQRLQVFHVADVLTQERVSAARDTERVLQLRPTRQQRDGLFSQMDGVRRIASRPADGQFGALEHAHDGVIAAHVDVTVM